MSVDFRGFPACECLAAWLPIYERELRRRHILGATEPLTIFQLIGNAPASHGVHSEGGAFDLLDLPGGSDLALAREMGADATWSRTLAQGFPPHIHGVLRGCPHNGPARYQIDAVDDGFNGLGRDGHGGPDDGPRPLSGRTWQEGITEMATPKDWDAEDYAALLENLAKPLAKTVWEFAINNAGIKAKAALELLYRNAGTTP